GRLLRKPRVRSTASHCITTGRRGDHSSPSPLGLGRIILLAVIDAGARSTIMGHTHGHDPRALAPVPIISRKADPVDSAIAITGPLGPQQHGIALEHGVRTRVPVAQPLHGLVLRDAGYGD